MPQTIELPRTGGRPLRFSGERLAAVATGSPDDGPRRHELAVYRAADGRLVAAVTLRTTFKDEIDRFDVFHAADPADLERWLRELPPCPDGIGYPPGAQFADRQARLAADLRRRYEAAVTDLFARLGPEFAEEMRAGCDGGL